MNEIDILQSLVGRRFKTFLNIAEEYKKLLENNNLIKDIILKKGCNFTQNDIESTNSYLIIPEERTRYDDEFDLDNNLISILNIGNDIYLDIDIFYLKDNAGHYYITEVGYSSQ